MRKPTRKHRPELLRPGLKALTPYEQRTVSAHHKANAKRWEYLFSLNLWKPAR